MKKMFFIVAVLLIPTVALCGLINWDDYIDKPEIVTSAQHEWRPNNPSIDYTRALASLSTAEPYHRCRDYLRGIYGYVDEQDRFVPVGPMCPVGKLCTCLVGGLVTSN
ncbi:MAG: hypothetical protein QXO76_01105 [Thermoproteota archaeon]